MASSQHKISRKELKQPDEFQTLVENIQDFVTDNLTQVIVSVVIVIVVAAIVIGVYAYERHEDGVASAQFYSSFSALTAGNYAAATQGFRTLAQDHPERQVGKLARFYLANAYIHQKNLPKARNSLIEFLAEDHDPNFTSLALNNLAVVYERMRAYRSAAGAYGQAAEIPGPEQLRAQIGVARMLAMAGDRKGAINAYQRFLAIHPFAPERREVVEALAQLGVATQSPLASATRGPTRVIDVPPASGTAH